MTPRGHRTWTCSGCHSALPASAPGTLCPECCEHRADRAARIDAAADRVDADGDVGRAFGLRRAARRTRVAT